MSLVLPYIPRLICDEECRHKIGGKGENASGKSEGVVLEQGSRLTAQDNHGAPVVEKGASTQGRIQNS